MTANNEGYIIDGIIPKKGVATLFGHSGSYKSFIALDMAFRVATGQPWGDQKVRKSPVVFIYTEGAFGIAKRVAGLEANHPEASKDASFYLMNLTPGHAEFDGLADFDLADFIREKCPAPGLIVIDGLSGLLCTNHYSGTRGEFSVAQDLRELANTLDCAVMLVGIGRSSVISGAADIALRSEKAPGEGLAYLYVTKCRDVERVKNSHIVLEKVSVGTDSDGDDITTLVIENIRHDNCIEE